MNHQRLPFLSGALLALVLSGCPNPADSVPAATVSEASAEPSSQPQTEEPGAEAAAESPTTEGEPAGDASSTLAFSNEGSEILFTGSKVTGSHDGGFGQFNGEIHLVENDPVRSRVRVEIQTDSLFSDSDRLTGHLKSDDFFDVAQFPTAVFESTTISAGAEGEATHTVTGNLTLHGVTKQIAFPATVALDADAVAVTADFAINRKDFEISFAGQPDDLIRDEVVVRLRIRASRA